MIQDYANRVGKNKKAKLVLTLIGAVSVTIGSLLIGSYIGAILLVSGILMEVFNVYAISVVTEQARTEIERNRSEIGDTLDEMKELDEDIENNRDEIGQMLSDMRELSGEINESKRELRNIQGEITDYQSELRTTKREIEGASEKAVGAKEEIKDLKRQIRRGARRR